MYGVEINKQGERSIFSLIMAEVAVGLLVGCGSNFEDTKNDHTVQAEQAADEQKLEEELDTLENGDAEDTGIEETESNEVGKTVIPFCISASSGLGESGELLEELGGSGEWKEGMRFQSNVSDEEVREWVESLGKCTVKSYDDGKIENTGNDFSGVS
ncbi:hypothetical protein AALA90_18425 [Lachnospiraceae bacterium 38-10]